MRKRKKTRLQEEAIPTLDRLCHASLAGVRGGAGEEPSPDDDNDIRAHIIETG